DDDSEPVIKLECCDNTRLLIDVQAPAGLFVSTTLPIDRAIADYLSNFPNFAGLNVLTLPAGLTPPTIKSALAGTAYQPQLGPPPAKGGGAVEKLSVWDYLTDVVGSLGYSIRVDGVAIITQQPMDLLNGAGGARPDDPFKGRTVDGETFTYRRIIWGRNLGKAKVSRKYAKNVACNVIVRCFPGDTAVAARGIHKGYERSYSGRLTTLVTRSGRRLSGTPNHPVLTKRGWVVLGHLVKGDELVCCSFGERVGGSDPHVDAEPTSFAQLLRTLRESFDTG